MTTTLTSPVTRPQLALLTDLAEGPLIVRDMRHSGARKSLRRDGLIAYTADPNTLIDDKPVVGFYTITDEGRHTLAEARELAAVESQYGRRLPFFKRFARRRAA